MPKQTYVKASSDAITRRNTYKTPFQDNFVRSAAADKFSGTSTISKNITPQDGIKHREVSLASENIVLTQDRALNLGGYYRQGRGFKDVKGETIAKKFNDFVHRNNVTGYFTDGSYSKMKQVSYPRTNGGRSYDIDAPLLLRKDDVKQFADENGLSVSDVMNSLGMKAVEKTGKTTVQTGKNKGKLQWSDFEYLETDFTSVENNNNTSEAGAYDWYVDKTRYGATYADKLAIDRQSKSLNKQ